MGIEPTREVTPYLENKPFGAMTNPKCDWRVNFRDMWRRAGPRHANSSLRLERNRSSFVVRSGIRP
jgi:hypothetical protein